MTRVTKRHLLLLVLLLVGSLPFVSAAMLPPLSAQEEAARPPAALTAPEILERVEKVYATCTTYRDAGVVQSVAGSKPAEGEQPDPDAEAGALRKSIPFHTAFVRPRRFRFECHVPLPGTTGHFIVFEDGTEVRTWWNLDKGEKHPGSLHDALWNALLWSETVSLAIPRLLVPSELPGGNLVKSLDQPLRHPDVQLDGVPCFVVQGVERTPATVSEETIWIDQSTFLVRRLRSVTDFNGTHIEKTTIYEPEINEEIGSGELAFAPPGAETLEEPDRRPQPMPHEEEFEPRFNHALVLLDSGEHDAALVEFEWLWDATNNPKTPYEPEIRPEVTQAIGRLAAVHPATFAHFRTMHDELDAAVRARKRASARSWRDWVDLGRALKVDERIVQLYEDRRSPTGVIRESVDFNSVVMDDLLAVLIKRKRYADAGRMCEDPAAEVESLCQILPEVRTDEDRWAQASIDYTLKYVRDRATRLYALTLAAGRTEEAAAAVRCLLANDDTVEARRALVVACLHFDVPCDSVPKWIDEIRRRGDDVADLERLLLMPPDEREGGWEKR